MIKLIYADGFYNKTDIEPLTDLAKSFDRNFSDYNGYCLEYNPHIFSKQLEFAMRSVVGDKFSLDKDVSGSFRKPSNCLIHFEEFQVPEEWSFVVALEKSTMNLYTHSSGAKTALEENRFNYRNLFEWNYNINILLNKGDAIFYRPWLFHSFESGLVQYFRLNNFGY